MNNKNKQCTFIARIVIYFTMTSFTLTSAISETIPGYQNEIVSEYSVVDDDSPFTIGIGHPSPFPKSKNKIEGHTSSRFFVNNKGIIFIMNQVNKPIKIVDILNNQVIEFRFRTENYNIMKYFWFGPEDEVYVWLSKRSDLTPSKFISKIVRFFPKNRSYDEDLKFQLPTMDLPPGTVNISPDGNIYMERSGLHERVFGSCDVFDSKGIFLGRSPAICNMMDGTEFTVRKERINDVIHAYGTQVDQGISLFAISGDFTRFKCTFDGNIIAGAWDYDRIPLPNDIYLQNDKPFMTIIDPATGDAIKIDPYLLCKNEDYKYHSVANIDCNYKGDIYASIIYFNEPGIITGEEKVVIYRWQKQ